MAAAFYICIVIAWSCAAQSRAAPGPAARAWTERWRASPQVWPAVLIAVVVVGGIYGGIFTPTEGAAVGASRCWSSACPGRRCAWAGAEAALLQTAETAGMIFAILLGADVFNAFLALSSCPDHGRRWIVATGLPPYVRDGAAPAVLHPARRGDGRAGDDPAHAAGVLSRRAGARFRHAHRRGRDLVRHPGADRGRHRADRAADRPQRLRGQRHGPRRRAARDLPRRAALPRHRRHQARRW
jgi:hypothetical protein